MIIKVHNYLVAKQVLIPFVIWGSPCILESCRKRLQGLEGNKGQIGKKRLSGWKGKLLSVGGLLVLVNSALSSLSMLMLSFYQILLEIVKRIEYQRSRFFWQMTGIKTNMCWSNGTFSANLKNKEYQGYKIRNTKQIPHEQVAS